MQTNRIQKKKNDGEAQRLSAINNSLLLKTYQKPLLNFKSPQPQAHQLKNNFFEEEKIKYLRRFLSEKRLKETLNGPDSSISQSMVKSDSLFEALFIKHNETTKKPQIEKYELGSIERWLKTIDEQVPELEETIVKDKILDSETINKIETVYMHALSEIIKQISVQHKKKGELLTKISKILKFVWKQNPDHSNILLQKEKDHSLRILEAYKLKIKRKIEKYKNEILAKDKKIENFISEKENLVNEIDTLKQYINKTHWEYEEFFKFRSKQLQMKTVFVQTEALVEITDEKSNESDDSYSEIDVLDKKQAEELKIAENEKIIKKEQKKEKFLIELKKLIEPLNTTKNISTESLIETLANETKNYKSWLNGFKLGLNLKTPVEILSEPDTKTDQPQLSYSSLSLPTILDTENTRGTSPYRLKTIKMGIQNPSSQKEALTAFSLISSTLSNSASSLQKYSKTPAKKLLKRVSQCIYLGLTKKQSQNSSFSDLILTDLLIKYNLKSIAERKFKELIVGCLMNYQSDLRIKLFLYCLGTGGHCNLKTYSQESCKMFFKAYDHMITSKTGIVLDNSDPLNIKLYPTCRALELAKWKFESLLAKNKYNAVLCAIEKLSIIDPIRINKTGVLCLDEFVELFVNTFEEIEKNISSGVNFCMNVVTEYKFLTKGECILLLRHLEPSKFFFLSSIKFDDNNEICVNEFTNFCIEKGLLAIDTVQLFFDKIHNNAKEIVAGLNKTEEKVLKSVKNNELTLSCQEWENKFDDLRIKLRSTSLQKSLQLWHLLKQEIIYLKIE